MIYPIRFKIIFLILFGLSLTGCASIKNNQEDPLESMNRAVFKFNETIDDNVFEPVARGYKKVIPKPIQMVVNNVFSNANDVVVAGNALLQLNFESAAATGARLLINTTFGIFGMIDIASDISATSDVNLNKRNEDFGQTLGHYGVGSGPYLVLPFLGPSSVRDAVGIGVDGFFADPITTGIYLNSVNALDTAIRVPVAAGRSLNARVQLLDVEKTLEEAALDKYEFTRDAYIQRRDSLIKNRDTSETN